jgi:hypothetical protein
LGIVTAGGAALDFAQDGVAEPVPGAGELNVLNAEPVVAVSEPAGDGDAAGA